MSAMRQLRGCGCEECQARLTGELILYCLKLEKAFVEIERLLDAGQAEAANALIRNSAALAHERDLSGEMRELARLQNEERAAELRAANRLH